MTSSLTVQSLFTTFPGSVGRFSSVICCLLDSLRVSVEELMLRRGAGDRTGWKLRASDPYAEMLIYATRSLSAFDLIRDWVLS